MDLVTPSSGMYKTLLSMAELLATSRSKDPKTKVGAVIYDKYNGGTYFGYNGLPRNFPDLIDIWHESEIAEFDKHSLVIHAEINAMHKALKAGCNLADAILLVTHAPCLPCLAQLSNAGLKKVIYKPLGPAMKYCSRLHSFAAKMHMTLCNFEQLIGDA